MNALIIAQNPIIEDTAITYHSEMYASSGKIGLVWTPIRAQPINGKPAYVHVIGSYFKDVVV